MRRRNHFQEQFHIATRPVVYRPTIPLTYTTTRVGEFSLQLYDILFCCVIRNRIPLATRTFREFASEKNVTRIKFKRYLNVVML